MRPVEIAMSSSQNPSINSSSPPPIILTPTDFPPSTNSSAVIVKKTSGIHQSNSFKGILSSHIEGMKNEIKDIFHCQPTEWINAFRINPKYPLFVIGDIDGFVGLFMNNLATLLAVILGLKNFFSDDLIYGKIVPG